MKRFRSLRSTSGAAAVEFALILAPFCIMLTGMIDYGWYFFVDLACTNAVRAGARSATTVPGAINACLGAASAQGTTTAKNALLNLIPGVAAYAPAANCGCLPDAAGNPQYTCTVNQAFTKLTGASFVPVPANINTAATMR